MLGHRPLGLVSEDAHGNHGPSGAPPSQPGRKDRVGQGVEALGVPLDGVAEPLEVARRGGGRSARAHRDVGQAAGSPSRAGGDCKQGCGKARCATDEPPVLVLEEQAEASGAGEDQRLKNFSSGARIIGRLVKDERFAGKLEIERVSAEEGDDRRRPLGVDGTVLRALLDEQADRVLKGEGAEPHDLKALKKGRAAGGDERLDHRRRGALDHVPDSEVSLPGGPHDEKKGSKPVRPPARLASSWTSSIAITR